MSLISSGQSNAPSHFLGATANGSDVFFSTDQSLLASDVDNNYDVNYLIRTIMRSATYQTSSRPLKENIDDDRYGSHYAIKRLPAEVLLDAYSQVTQVHETFDGYPTGMLDQDEP